MTCITYAGAVILCSFHASVASAGLVHPDVMGDTVWFRGIEESSPTADPLPLYGQPVASGDTLTFPTTGDFSADSLNGGLPDHTDGKLSFTIEAKPFFALSSFAISENGLTILNAPFGGDAFVEVVSFAVVKIAEIAGQPVNSPAFGVFLTLSPLGGQYQLSVIGGASFAAGWSGTVNVPFPQETSKVNVTLNNNLFAATTGAGTRAFVDKKAFGISVGTVTSNIPEPSTLALCLAGAFACAPNRRRWRRAC